MAPELPLVSCTLPVCLGKFAGTPIVLNQATHEIREQYLDCARVRSRLQWTPTYGLEAGLAKTVEWYRGYLNGQAE